MISFFPVNCCYTFTLLPLKEERDAQNYLTRHLCVKERILSQAFWDAVATYAVTTSSNKGCYQKGCDVRGWVHGRHIVGVLLCYSRNLTFVVSVVAQIKVLCVMVSKADGSFCIPTLLTVNLPPLACLLPSCAIVCKLFQKDLTMIDLWLPSITWSFALIIAL